MSANGRNLTSAFDPTRQKAVLQQCSKAALQRPAIRALIVEVRVGGALGNLARQSAEACAYETSSVVHPSRRAKDRAVLSQ